MDKGVHGVGLLIGLKKNPKLISLNYKINPQINISSNLIKRSKYN